VVADLPAEAVVRGAADDVVRSGARHWGLVAHTAVTVTLAAWLIAAMQPKRYQSEAIVSVSPIVAQLSDSELLHGIDALERRVVVATVAALASSDSTRRRTTRALRGDYGIDATVLPSTNLIRIRVEGPDPEQVAAIANRIPPLLDEQTRAMYRVYTIGTVSAGVVPKAPFLPRVERAVIVGLVLGVLLGVAIAYLIERRRALRSARAYVAARRNVFSRQP
jgi:capsular polysaccharide biosynthesis protein